MTTRELIGGLLARTGDWRAKLRPAHRNLAARLPLPLQRQYLFATALFRIGNFVRPRSFNEKVNWRILHDRRPMIAAACDKLAMKAMARERLDASRLRIAVTLWSGVDVDTIPDDLLAGDGILKPNHSSGQVMFLPSTRDEVHTKTDGWLTARQSDLLGEWGYSAAQHCLVLEERIPSANTLIDYKFFCFDGAPAAIEVHNDRFGTHSRTYYDTRWHMLPVRSTYLGPEPMPRPDTLDEMLAVAEELSRGWDFIRIDLYEVDGQIWFGEYSPHPNGGVSNYTPRAFDAWLGELWPLPSRAEAAAS